jgi:hypothetical protein
MNDLGHHTPQSNHRADGPPSLHTAATPGNVTKALDPLKELRTFDKETRRDLVRLGASSDPAIILRASMPFPQLAKALENAPADKRVAFITPFITASLGEAHLRPYVRDKVPFLLQHLSNDEKGDLVRHLFDHTAGRRRDRYELAAEIFRACDDLADLKELCRNVGSQIMRRTRSAQMLDILARHEIIDSLRDLRIPCPLMSCAKIDQAELYLDELDATLREARRIVRSDPLLAHTPFGKRMRNIIDANIRLIAREREEADDAAEFRELANSIAAKLKLEFRYGVAITLRQERGQRLVDLWSTSEVAEIDRTLRRFPECLVVLSKHLETIRKTPDDELSTPTETVFGLWIAKDGTIQLREGLHVDSETRKAYGNKSPLGVILTHEFAHVYESDRGYDIAQAKLEDGRNPPLFHSSEYRRISGWSVVEPSKYRITHGGKSAVIDGVSYRVAHDVAKLEGKDVFLVYHADTRKMFSHPVRAEWSIDDYSRANPSEDFAVSFAEYFRLPRQLAEFAPSKFLLLEEHFQKYARNPRIMALVSTSRTSRERHEVPTEVHRPVPQERREQFERFMAERFDQMTGGERAWVLANLTFVKEDRTDTSQIYPLYRAYKEKEPRIVRAQFSRCLVDPALYDATGDIVFDVLKTYKPAHLALLAAKIRGAELGVLTLRSGREGNLGHINALAQFAGYDFMQRNLYFVSDETLNLRVRHLPSGAARKAQILEDFAAGEYRTATGEIQPLHRRYDRVIFYEDEQRNLEAAREKARQFPAGRLVIIDANRIDPERIWRGICQTLRNGEVKPHHSAREIVFFDLDGTMFDVAATINLVNQRNGTIVRRLTQHEFSAKPEAAWIEDAMAADPAVHREDLVLDFGDFRLAHRVAQQIEGHPRHLRRSDLAEIRRDNRRKRTGRPTE